MWSHSLSEYFKKSLADNFYWENIFCLQNLSWRGKKYFYQFRKFFCNCLQFNMLWLKFFCQNESFVESIADDEFTWVWRDPSSRENLPKLSYFTQCDQESMSKTNFSLELLWNKALWFDVTSHMIVHCRVVSLIWNLFMTSTTDG